jgi:translation initiation factor 2 subunit 2
MLSILRSMDLTYEEMLQRAYLSIPKEALEHERFEIPRADSLIQGKKTFVRNVDNLIKEMRRDKKHFLKYLTKETGTSVTQSGANVIINGKLGAIQLNKLIESYFKQFVLCSECGKPDTKIILQQGTKMMKCEACGAITPVKGI